MVSCLTTGLAPESPDIDDHWLLEGLLDDSIPLVNIKMENVVFFAKLVHHWLVVWLRVTLVNWHGLSHNARSHLLIHEWWHLEARGKPRERWGQRESSTFFVQIIVATAGERRSLRHNSLRITNFLYRWLEKDLSSRRVQEFGSQYRILTRWHD